MKIKLLLLLALLSFTFGCKHADQVTKDVFFHLGDSTISDTLHIYGFSNICGYYQGYYNPKKYSPERTRNTVNLCLSMNAIALTKNRDVFEPEDTLKLSLDSLERDYSETLAMLQPGKFIQKPKWEHLRRLKVKELQAEYEFRKIYISAWKDPEALRKTSLSKSCEKYVDALCSKDTLVILDAWKDFAEEKAKENKYSWEKYKKESSSPIAQRLIFAKIDLLTFGWANCANNNTYHFDPNKEKFDQDKELQSIFTKLEVNPMGCD